MDERVGDVVWYVSGSDPQPKARITALDGKTHATIRLLSGPEKGKEFLAPWGVIQTYDKRETYKGWAIQLIPRQLEDGAFSARGFIRKPVPGGSGLPFETSFDNQERHLTEKAAVQAGMVFAKKKIDGR